MIHFYESGKNLSCLDGENLMICELMSIKTSIYFAKLLLQDALPSYRWEDLCDLRTAETAVVI